MGDRTENILNTIRAMLSDRAFFTEIDSAMQNAIRAGDANWILELENYKQELEESYRGLASVSNELIKAQNRNATLRGALAGANQPAPAETAAPAQGEGAGKSKPWDDTSFKLKKLREIRNEGKAKGQIPGWVTACGQARIAPKTAREHDPELRERWDDPAY